MALDEHFCWGPSFDLLWDSCNGALWLEHCVIINQLFLLFEGDLHPQEEGWGGYIWMHFLIDKVGGPIT